MALNRYLYDLKNYLIDLMLILPELSEHDMNGVLNLLESVNTVLAQCIGDMTLNYADIFINLSLIANLIDLHEHLELIAAAEAYDFIQ